MTFTYEKATGVCCLLSVVLLVFSLLPTCLRLQRRCHRIIFLSPLISALLHLYIHPSIHPNRSHVVSVYSHLLLRFSCCTTSAVPALCVFAVLLFTHTFKQTNIRATHTRRFSVSFHFSLKTHSLNHVLKYTLINLNTFSAAL